jgi:Uma2 family endonuclease
METLILEANKRYSFADYLTWVDNKRCELIEGFIRMMSPAPKPIHQEVSFVIGTQLYHFIKKKRGRCKVYPAPFDVRLPQNGETNNEKIYTVVQPDICVICDLSKIDDYGCLGAPDLIVEVQSLSTGRYDFTTKYSLYEAAGVREYWVVSPYEGVIVFVLQSDGKYDEGATYDIRQKIPVHIFEGCELDLREVFV